MDPESFAKFLDYTIQNSSILTYVGLGKMGRLGNQLFEIAAVLAVAKKNQCRILFPESVLDQVLFRHFDLKVPVTQKIFPDRVLPETSNFDDVVIPNDGKIYALHGYRQSVKYLEPIQGDLRRIFRRDEIFPGEYIGVHIRRTDYIKNNPILNYFDAPLLCSLEYYAAGIKRLREKYKLPEDFPVKICTDDREWVSRHLHEIDAFAELSSGGSLEEDLSVLMSAKYLVIANSTLSLWCGLLGSAGDRIVAPSMWVSSESKVMNLLGITQQHFCPPNWIFHSPLTGEQVNSSYNWPDSEPGILTKIFRGIATMNEFRL